jgi:DNA repair protein RecO (recombination protein O)
VTLYRDEGVVLRTQKLGEADRIVTVLTREHGRVRAVAKGVRRTKSKFGARLEPFSHVDVQCHVGRSLDVVTQVESLAAFGAPIAADYARYTAGTAMLETSERLTDVEREPSPQMYLLLVGGLRSLSAGAHDPTSILDSFLLRALSVSGYAPSFDACVRCGLPGPHRWFAVSTGGSVCQECRQPGSVTVGPETLLLLGALLSGEWTVVDASDPRTRREASGVVAAYLQWHLERGLRSLRMVERT